MSPVVLSRKEKPLRKVVALIDPKQSGGAMLKELTTTKAAKPRTVQISEIIDIPPRM